MPEFLQTSLEMKSAELCSNKNEIKAYLKTSFNMLKNTDTQGKIRETGMSSRNSIVTPRKAFDIFNGIKTSGFLSEDRKLSNQNTKILAKTADSTAPDKFILKKNLIKPSQKSFTPVQAENSTIVEINKSSNNISFFSARQSNNCTGKDSELVIQKKLKFSKELQILTKGLKKMITKIYQCDRIDYETLKEVMTNPQQNVQIFVEERNEILQQTEVAKQLLDTIDLDEECSNQRRSSSSQENLKVFFKSRSCI